MHPGLGWVHGLGGARRMACVIGSQGLIQVRGAAPVVSYEVPVNAATSGGATVTISGLSFGVYGFTPTANVAFDADCGTTSWSSATSVACTLRATTRLTTSYSKLRMGQDAVGSALVGTKATMVFTFDGAAMANFLDFRPWGAGLGKSRQVGGDGKFLGFQAMGSWSRHV